VLARETAWRRLHEPYDVLVIGGGVTGAAVLWEAARRGLRAALVERGDFASGTSSRSSKLVHGGLRYLKEGKIGLTRESVRERQELLRGAPGLVDAVPFLMPHYRKRKPSRATLAAGLALYDALAGAWQHRYVDRDEALALVPSLDRDELQGAHCYLDATTDDARLVLRLIAEACDAGATAINYVDASVATGSDGNVTGARLRDAAGSRGEIELQAKAVIAATGVFADRLRGALGAAPRLRPLRGSHLILPDWRLPLTQSVAFEHPHDGRPVFAYPWLGRTLVGTTDLDHARSLDDEPAISPQETAYLVAAVRYQFPAARIDGADTIATFAGVRPVIDAGAGDPSRASRDHAVWNERGLITITGGKLTTFRPMAMDALAAAAPRLPAFDRAMRPSFSPAALPEAPRLCEAARRRLAGRYGAHAGALVFRAGPGELETIDGTGILWAELRWAAEREAVVRLDDLLLRRTRLGLLAADGGARHLPRIGEICRQALDWDDARWRDEAEAYRARWNECYRVPEASTVPDWREYL
jgi:glycerol-3-phosphate dehydrogenase